MCRTEADRGAFVFITSTDVTHVIAVCAHGPDELCNKKILLKGMACHAVKMRKHSA